MSPRQTLGQTKVLTKDAARIVDRYIAYARFQLKCGQGTTDNFELRCYLHTSLTYLNSALLCYGAEIALSRNIPLLDDSVWLLYTRYQRVYGQSEVDIILSELAALEVNAESWLCRLGSACTQLALSHTLQSVKPSLNGDLFNVASLSDDVSNTISNATISSTFNLDIYNDTQGLCRVIEESFLQLDSLIERHRDLSAEF